MPSDLLEQLTNDEYVLARVNDVYATNKRVIQYSNNPFNESFRDIGYGHVSSENFETKKNIVPLLLSLAIGFVLFKIANWETGNILSVLGIIFILFGVVVYFKSKNTVLEIHSTDGIVIPIANATSDVARDFIKTVRENMR